MARLRGHSALDVERPLFVRRGNADAPWTLCGRSFVSGDAFPWREMGIPARKLFQLWDQRRIGHESPRERNGAESVTDLVKPIVVAPSKKRKPS